MLIWLDAFCAKYPHIIEAFGALAPFFGTVFLAYIAYQQWQTNERKRKQELFEMRYEKLYTNLYKINNKDITDNDRTDILNAIAKYKYLIKEKDFSVLIQSIVLMRKVKKKESHYLDNKILLLMEKYLRIEPEETIWDIIKNWIIDAYEFLTPKWLQNLISEHLK